MDSSESYAEPSEHTSLLLMGVLDWVILVGFLAYTIWDGIRHTQEKRDLESLVLASRQTPWWAAGLSVMATQASAITFIGTTGLAFMHDMRFLQVYLGLPLAMVILSVTLVPLYHRLKVYTIYEALEDRFGLRLRLTTSFLFLLSRGASLGFSISAPAYVLALLFGVPLKTTIIIMGIIATIYTMFGGIGGVIRTDMKQMILMMLALVFCLFWIIGGFPADVSWLDGLRLAGKLDKLTTIDLSFDPQEKYNLWSGIIAGGFLMLSYFGADQSQVQRVLTARTLADARSSLLMSGILKVPLQFFILLIGVYLYIFYVFEDRPLLFKSSDQTAQMTSFESDFQQIQDQRKVAARNCLSGNCTDFIEKDKEAVMLRKKALHEASIQQGKVQDDTNYVFPFFILSQLPTGVVGLILAAILAAALSSIDSGLNSLATSSVIDWLRRLQSRPRGDRYYYLATRWATAAWGVLATSSAVAFGETDAIIEIVNKVGSFFYGPILGVFILLWLPRATSKSAFWGFILGFAAVVFIGGWYLGEETQTYIWEFPFGMHPEGYHPMLEYLWLNPIGVLVVILCGMGLGNGKKS
ncbi:MAG: sodium-coupled permease [Bacteroidota bacterium]